MIQWLAPIALFTTLSAMYLGGFRIRIEGGNANQVLGLLVMFVLFLVVYSVVRIALAGVVGTIAAIVFGCIVAALAMPFYGPIAFRVVGARITKDVAHP